MNYLDYGTRFIFAKYYVTKNRNHRKGTKCNILNGVIVLGRSGKFLFDVNSNLAKKIWRNYKIVRNTKIKRGVNMKLEDILISKNNGKEFSFKFEGRKYKTIVVEEGEGLLYLQDHNGIDITRDFYLSQLLEFDFKEIN